MIFRYLFDTYIIKKDEKESTEFKKLFTKEEYFEEISQILFNEKKYVNDNKKVSDDLILKIDNVIGKSTNLR
jgi:hypothetical protein